MMQIKRKMINIADIVIEDKRWSDFGIQDLADRTFSIVFDVLNLQYIITSLPTSGTLKQGTNTISSSDLPYTSKVKDPMVTYTPNTSFSGTDTFNFKLNDLIDDSNVATVTINVSGDGFNLEDDNNKIQVSRQK